MPGASLYEVQLGPYKSGLGCDFSFAPTHGDAARDAPPRPPGRRSAKTLPANRVRARGLRRSAAKALVAGTYCVRVLARTDEDAQHNQVISAWTQINGVNHAAFTFAEQPAPGTASAEGLVTQAGDYIAPKTGFQPGCRSASPALRREPPIAP